MVHQVLNALGRKVGKAFKNSQLLLAIISYVFLCFFFYFPILRTIMVNIVFFGNCILNFRITPTLMFVILLQAKIVPLVDKSPLWFTVTNDQSCKDYWWTNLLYMNNFHPSNTYQDSVKIKIKCFIIIIKNIVHVLCVHRQLSYFFRIVSIFLLSPIIYLNSIQQILYYISVFDGLGIWLLIGSFSPSLRL